VLTKERVRSLFWAALISSVFLIGVFANREGPDGQADWGRWLFSWFPIRWVLWSLPVFRAGSPHGARSAWYDIPIAFVISVVIWWAFVEGGRTLWKRVARVTGPR
jgi:hypothetical protein